MRFSHALAYSFGKKLNNDYYRKDLLYNPSPAQYHPKEQKYRNSPKWKIGTEIRVKRNINNNPAPNQYYPKSKLTQSNAPRYSIGLKFSKSFMDIDKPTTPSPADYNPKLMSSSPHYSIGTRLRNKRTDTTPGPGRYNVSDKITVKLVKSYKFGKSAKNLLNNIKPEKTVGPAYYNTIDSYTLTKPKQPIYSFTKGLRYESKKDVTPSPNKYNIKESFGTEGRKSTIGKRLNPSKSEIIFNPGPGAYNLTESEKYKYKKSPNILFSKDSKDKFFSKTLSDTPGPSDYCPERQYTALKPKAPSAHIGKSLRQVIDFSESIGPGHYETKSSFGIGPKFSISGKGSDINYKTISPGPSRYYIKDSITKKSTPSFKIGCADRDDNLKSVIKENVPGPASYNPTLFNRVSSPKYKFSKSKKSEDIQEDKIGPGYYHIPCSIVDVNDYTRNSGKFNYNFRYI